MEAQPTFFRLEFGDTFSLSLSPSTPAFNGGERRQAEATQWQYVYMAGKEIERGTQTCRLLDLLPPFLPLGGFRLNFVSSPFSYSILGGNRKESIIFGIAIKKKERGNGSCMGLHAGSVKDSREGRHLGENECIRSTSLTLGYGAKKGMLLPGISFHLFQSL